ncbi:hypothetical protein CVT26_008374 [Gymnopilus dilepis]|uniref:Uncharacterized protein n=1 Tax=Gymnopilus dilepis TaxID=231916 RepID=A0A409XYD4_9AGAR|nr:hypothetical protein CVT26_008374 [Gymnopilus dilepis]
MAVHGIQCINWPENVPFPGECAPHTKRRLRFRELSVDALARLATAFNQTGAEAPTFVPVGRFELLVDIIPVIRGVAPSASSVHAHGRDYFLSGKVTRTGLPRSPASGVTPAHRAPILDLRQVEEGEGESDEETGVTKKSECNYHTIRQPLSTLKRRRSTAPSPPSRTFEKRLRTQSPGEGSTPPPRRIDVAKVVINLVSSDSEGDDEANSSLIGKKDATISSAGQWDSQHAELPCMSWPHAMSPELCLPARRSLSAPAEGDTNEDLDPQSRLARDKVALDFDFRNACTSVNPQDLYSKSTYIEGDNLHPSCFRQAFSLKTPTSSRLGSHGDIDVQTSVPPLTGVMPSQTFASDFPDQSMFSSTRDSPWAMGLATESHCNPAGRPGALFDHDFWGSSGDSPYSLPGLPYLGHLSTPIQSDPNGSSIDNQGKTESDPDDWFETFIKYPS